MFISGDDTMQFIYVQYCMRERIYASHAGQIAELLRLIYLTLPRKTWSVSWNITTRGN